MLLLSTATISTPAAELLYLPMPSTMKPYLHDFRAETLLAGIQSRDDGYWGWTIGLRSLGFGMLWVEVSGFGVLRLKFRFQVGGNSALGLGLGALFWGFMVVLFVDRASRLGFGPPYHKANDGVI